MGSQENTAFTLAALTMYQSCTANLAGTTLPKMIADQHDINSENIVYGKINRGIARSGQNAHPNSPCSTNLTGANSRSHKVTMFA